MSGRGAMGDPRPPAGCPGRPDDCRHASSVLLAAAEGIPHPGRTAELRSRLSGCVPCLEAFDLQMNVQSLVALHCREQAPESLRIRISETLQRVDLGQLDVSDL